MMRTGAQWVGVLFVGGLLGMLPDRASAQCGTRLQSALVVGGPELSGVLFVASPPGDSERLFLVLQGGQIKVYKPATGALLDFLTITVTAGGERGLLGLAFDPDYASNRRFYVNYTLNVSGQLRTFIVRYTARADNPDQADPNSGLEILSFVQPYANHNGGWLGFGPDGYLYIATGDGGSAGDPQDRAQNLNELLGKMLRLDVRNSSVESPYDIPPDNPFVGTDGRDEIWAYGLRNPWRDSFDRLTGDLYIADVGQGAWEEVDFQPAGSPGGENYGWDCYEGDAPYELTGCPPAETMVFPIHTYSHASGCSITGGYVYRGPRIWDLRGTYFFADYCSVRFWSFRYDGSTLTDFRERTAELNPGGLLDSIVSFGEDDAGELYICDSGGAVYRIEPNGPVVGDLNGDGRIDAFDIDPFVLALTDPEQFRLLYPDIDPFVTGDINCDGALDAFDIDPFVALLTGG